MFALQAIIMTKTGIPVFYFVIYNADFKLRGAIDTFGIRIRGVTDILA